MVLLRSNLTPVLMSRDQASAPVLGTENAPILRPQQAATVASWSKQMTVPRCSADLAIVEQPNLIPKSFLTHHKFGYACPTYFLPQETSYVLRQVVSAKVDYFYFISRNGLEKFPQEPQERQGPALKYGFLWWARKK